MLVVATSFEAFYYGFAGDIGDIQGRNNLSIGGFVLEREVPKAPGDHQLAFDVESVVVCLEESAVIGEQLFEPGYF